MNADTPSSDDRTESTTGDSAVSEGRSLGGGKGGGGPGGRRP